MCRDRGDRLAHHPVPAGPLPTVGWHASPAAARHRRLGRRAHRIVNVRVDCGFRAGDRLAAGGRAGQRTLSPVGPCRRAGSAKTTLAGMLRALVDPNVAPLRALPRDDRDVFIAASNGHLLAFDNVSGLPYWLSDTLCRLATGGGFATRQLYTDADEVLFDAARPIVLNGIEDMVADPISPTEPSSSRWSRFRGSPQD